MPQKYLIKFKRKVSDKSCWPIGGRGASLRVMKVTARHSRQESSHEKPHRGTRAPAYWVQFTRMGAQRLARVREHQDARSERWVSHGLNMWNMDQMDSYSSGKHIAHDPVIPPLDTYQEKREHMFTNRLT